MKNFNMENPDEWGTAWKQELSTFYTELKQTHAGRKKRPLKFVELFESAEKRLPHFEKSGWESVEKELGYVKKLLDRLKPDYLASLVPAGRQADRREFWDRFYNPSAHFLEGGRADGNKS